MNISKAKPVKRTIYTKQIDNEEFVELWMRANSVAEVADHFNVPETAISSKAYWLRKKGVKLPVMVKTYTEVDKLNTMIKRLSK